MLHRPRRFRARGAVVAVRVAIPVVVAPPYLWRVIICPARSSAPRVGPIARRWRRALVSRTGGAWGVPSWSPSSVRWDVPAACLTFFFLPTVVLVFFLSFAGGCFCRPLSLLCFGGCGALRCVKVCYLLALSVRSLRVSSRSLQIVCRHRRRFFQNHEHSRFRSKMTGIKEILIG